MSKNKNEELIDHKNKTSRKYDAHFIAIVHVTSWQKIISGHIPDEMLDNLSITEHEERLDQTYKKVV